MNLILYCSNPPSLNQLHNRKQDLHLCYSRSIFRVKLEAFSGEDQVEVKKISSMCHPAILLSIGVFPTCNE